MPNNDTKNCPYCAEPVRVAAILCPHCRSRLHGGLGSTEAYRNRPGRQVAGVSTALADAFGVSVTFIRLAFIVLTFLSFIGPPLYLALWLLLPAEPGGATPLGSFVSGDGGEPSILDRALQTLERLFVRVSAWLRGETPPDTPDTTHTTQAREATSGPDTPAEGTP